MKELAYTSLAVIVFSSFAHAGETSDFVRKVVKGNRESAQWLSLKGNLAWPSGVYQWYYNPSGQPAAISTEDAVAALHAAAARWAHVCNVNIQYMGLTNIAPETQVDDQPDYVNVWGWKGFWRDDVYKSGYSLSWMSGDYTRIVDSDIVLNAFESWDLAKLDGVMTHEIGHSLGLAHSDVSESVMFANPYHSATYIRTLRGDDALGCAVLYGASPNAMVERTMNWAEQAYADLLYNIGPAPTATKDGFRYRYYQYSKNYAMAKDGMAYYIDANGAVENLGPLSNFEARVKAAGF